MRKPSCDKQDTNKGAWSKQEDQKLIDYIRTNEEGSWRSIPQASGLLRCGKSCRVRRMKYLSPEVKRRNFAEDEEDLIIRLHALLGNRWSLIAGRLPGRTDKEVENYWNSNLRLKLVSMGIDPNNHRLRNSSGIATVKLNSKEDEHLGTTRNNTCMQPNSNLDLNMSLPSPPCAVNCNRVKDGI